MPKVPLTDEDLIEAVGEKFMEDDFQVIDSSSLSFFLSRVVLLCLGLSCLVLSNVHCLMLSCFVFSS